MCGKFLGTNVLKIKLRSDAFLKFLFKIRLKRETYLMQACSANQHQVIMPSWLPKVPSWLRKNALCLSQSAFSNFALHVINSFIDNDTRHHSGQNVVDWRGAAEWVRSKFWPLWWRVSLSIKLYTTLNHIRFVFYHNNIKETTLTRIWKCTRCIMQMSCLYASDSLKNFCKLA